MSDFDDWGSCSGDGLSCKSLFSCWLSAILTPCGQRGFLLRALRAHDGNISRTAESIGMVRQSLQQKIRELELRSEDWSGEKS